MIYREIERLDDSIALQEDLDEVTYWTDRYKMTVNTDKTSLIRFCRSRNLLSWSYVMNGSALAEGHDCKYLGMTITRDLQWGPHISGIVSKAYRALHFVMRVIGKGSRQ